MPEGKTKTPIRVTLTYNEYSHNNANGISIHTFYISGDNYLSLPLDANVRDPTEKSNPYKEMVNTLEKNSKNFFLQNSGISVIASNVKIIDKQKKKVEINFPPGTGIVNGGHTQLAVLDTKNRRDISEALIKLEVIEHDFSPQELAIIAASRNTASNVQPYSTAEKKGYFFKIKQQILPDFEKQIVWWENREVPNNRGLSALDLIALMNLFNIKKYKSDYNKNSSDQPNKSATSKTAVFKEWESTHPEPDQSIYPLITDIINLYEHVLTTFDKNIPRGFTGLNVIKNIKNRSQKTIFLGKTIKFELPKQFLLPLLASLRANIKYDENNNKVGWYEKPEQVFDKVKYTLISDLMKQFKNAYHGEINRASKDPGLWRILYLDADQKVDKTKEWKMYDIPK
ncbi:AIPR family protein [Candidatus Woesearchaeota archaeon]|nr:AIPR family protein [Candidatus Woesearchaeota archaeon]